MDKLKAILAAKKQQKADLFAGSKYKKRKELDDANLMRLREEEERERARKKRSTAQVEDAAPANEQEEEAQDERLQMKPREEVIKHLRALREPATLFGEDDVMRWKRLQRAEKELHLEDEVAAPDMANVLLEVQLEEKKKKGKAAGQDKVAERGRNQEDAETGKDETLLAFERAAAQLAEAKSEETMQLEDRLAKSFRRWMQEWEEDLDLRPAEVKEAREGRQATFRFRETQKWMEPMFEKLESRAVNAEVLAGMHMIMQAIKERNYSYAIDIYMKVAIGNSAWPIGVTSVGIHSRSAREKISHSMNVSGQAHVMNDEATRKFLWGVKRLCTFLQRLYPTEPSRAVDFNAVQAAGLGSAGGGDGKVALLEAEAHGETWQNMGLPLAPHFMNEDGGVKVPAKWAHTLREYSERVNGTNGAAAASSASPVKPGSVKAARR